MLDVTRVRHGVVDLGVPNNISISAVDVIHVDVVRLRQADDAAGTAGRSINRRIRNWPGTHRGVPLVPWHGQLCVCHFLALKNTLKR